MNKLVYKISIAFFLLIIISGFAAAQEKNLTTEEKAVLCLNESRQIFAEMQNESFNVKSINESLVRAQNTFNAHLVLKEQNKKYDFSLVLPDCETIRAIRENASSSRDELIALMKFYNESYVAGMNTSKIDALIEEIKKEIEDERYGKVKSLIDRGYTEIIEAKSSYTTFNLFMSTTTRGLKSFFFNNWIYIASFFGILIILFIIYKKKISVWLIQRKIERLEIRKKTLRGLIMQTQKDYFQNGKIPEGVYTVRTKKFAELIRNIDRDIPLLREGLARIEKSKRKTEK